MDQWRRQTGQTVTVDDESVTRIDGSEESSDDSSSEDSGSASDSKSD